LPDTNKDDDDDDDDEMAIDFLRKSQLFPKREFNAITEEVPLKFYNSGRTQKTSDK